MLQFFNAAEIAFQPPLNFNKTRGQRHGAPSVPSDVGPAASAHPALRGGATHTQVSQRDQRPWGGAAAASPTVCLSLPWTSPHAASGTRDARAPGRGRRAGRGSGHPDRSPPPHRPLRSLSSGPRRPASPAHGVQAGPGLPATQSRPRHWVPPPPAFSGRKRPPPRTPRGSRALSGTLQRHPPGCPPGSSRSRGKAPPEGPRLPPQHPPEGETGPRRKVSPFAPEEQRSCGEKRRRVFRLERRGRAAGLTDTGKFNRWALFRAEPRRAGLHPGHRMPLYRLPNTSRPLCVGGMSTTPSTEGGALQPPAEAGGPGVLDRTPLPRRPPSPIRACLLLLSFHSQIGDAGGRVCKAHSTHRPAFPGKSLLTTEVEA